LQNRAARQARRQIKMLNSPQFFEPRALLRARTLLDEGARLGIACSGGGDSVFLLLAAFEAFPHNAAQFEVLHFNHKVRKNSDSDEKFVRALCKRLKLKLSVGRPEEAFKTVTEDSLREARLHFFKQSAAKRGLSAILQGHHAGDVAETVLMRLMRGSGAGGLSAPRPVSNAGGLELLRPLLNLSKAEIIAELKARKESWCEDESNCGDGFLRNRLRNRIIPLLKEVSEFDFENSALRTRMLLQEDDDALSALLEEELATRNALSKNSLFLTPKSAKSAALARRAVYALSEKSGIKLKNKAADIDAFVSAVMRGESFKLSAGGNFLAYSSHNLEIFLTPASPAKYALRLKEGANALPCGGIVTLEKMRVDVALLQRIKAGMTDHEKEVYLNIPASEVPLCARPLLKDDAYTPIGGKKTRQVSRIFADKKVHPLKRLHIPLVITKSGRIAWAVGCPPCDAFKIVADGLALRLTYTP